MIGLFLAVLLIGISTDLPFLTRSIDTPSALDGDEQQRLSGSSTTDAPPLRTQSDDNTPAPERQPLQPRQPRQASLSPEALRPVKLKFESSVLSWVATAWRFQQLRVDLRDEQGRVLVVIHAPWKPAFVQLPRRLRRVVVVAPGYEKQTLPAPPTFVKGDKPTTIDLRPDAEVEVVVRNVPAIADMIGSVYLSLPYGRDDFGKDRFWDGVAQCGGLRPTGRRRQITCKLAVPSGIDAKVTFCREEKPGNIATLPTTGLVSLRSETFRLLRGERRRVVLEYPGLGQVQGRVTGLPAVSFSELTVGLVSPGGRTVQSRVRRDGSFEFAGLPATSFSLQLLAHSFATPWVPLREPGTNKVAWTHPAGFLTVEPATPLFTVAPVRNGQPIEPFACALGWRPNAKTQRSRILSTRSQLEKGPIWIWTRDAGTFQASIRGLEPDAAGVFRVEATPALGSVELTLRGEPRGKARRLVSLRPEGKGFRHNVYAESVDGDTYKFDAVPAGRYVPRLLLYLDGRYCSGSFPTIVVRDGRRTRAEFVIPETVTAHGEVVNWAAIPQELRPTQVRLEFPDKNRKQSQIKDGRFSWRGFAPLSMPGKVHFVSKQHPLLLAAEVVPVPAEQRLLVRFPDLTAFRTIHAGSIAGGGLWLHVAPRQSRGADILPEAHGSFRVHKVDEPTDVILLENAYDGDVALKVLRGWFRIDRHAPDTLRPSFGGRWITVRMASAKARARVRWNGPTWWGTPRYAWPNRAISGSKPQRLWQPAQATSLVVMPASPSAGRRQVIPVADIAAANNAVVIQPKLD